ncbi:hypothetical protein C6401_12765 [Arthrobacter woluwensis]|uniref:barstar family protein n=1 Tax=Arthrobacter woluwensis TaxID=156980 RepID=UPI000D13D56B|nr:barstar family protein [Arthrobacter woluwensis]PSS43276.1 hypothetical protein C6401_12765 [Arthrobacter woluwensis]
MFLSITAPYADIYPWIKSRRDHGFAVVKVRGRKSATISDFMNEISAAFQFPEYFGENWAALDECLADLDPLPSREGIALVITNAGAFLSNEPGSALATFIGIVQEAMRTYESPDVEEGYWERPALAFEVLLQFDDEPPYREVRWIEAGATMCNVPPLSDLGRSSGRPE